MSCESIADNEEETEVDNDAENDDDDKETTSQVPAPLTDIGPQAILLGHSLVNICLSQLCKSEQLELVIYNSYLNQKVVTGLHDSCCLHQFALICEIITIKRCYNSYLSQNVSGPAPKALHNSNYNT